MGDRQPTQLQRSRFYLLPGNDPRGQLATLFSFDALRRCEHLFKRLKFVGKLVADFYNLTGCLGVGTAAIVHGNEGRSKDKRAALTFCRNQMTVSAFVGLAASSQSHPECP